MEKRAEENAEYANAVVCRVVGRGCVDVDVGRKVEVVVFVVVAATLATAAVAAHAAAQTAAAAGQQTRRHHQRLHPSHRNTLACHCHHASQQIINQSNRLL